MKFMLIATLIMSSLSSFAARVGEEAAAVNRLLLNNPEVVAQLKEKSIPDLYDFESKDIGKGVTKYVLKYGRACHCLPANAVVTILEDRTPTYVDGSATYEAKVEISDAE